MPAVARSATDLTTAMREGRRMRFLFFWGHRPQRDGSIGSGCLSQWWPAAFTVDGLRFTTAEHYLMWRKATLFGADDIATEILAAPHPHAAKNLGRQVAGFDEQRWVRHRYGIVVAGNLAKFDQHPDLWTFLLGTGGRVLVEASPVDRIWGIGLAADDPAAADPGRWPGLNLLGFALMEVRTVLRDRDQSGG
ncbi:MAG TPA: NADAR family protein [Catenuloplanes sp.]|jgi:hypothetical protein